MKKITELEYLLMQMHLSHTKAICDLYKKLEELKK